MTAPNTGIITCNEITLMYTDYQTPKTQTRSLATAETARDADVRGHSLCLQSKVSGV